MSEPVWWLSQVCDVITEPSLEALAPTMMDVQANAAPPKTSAQALKTALRRHDNVGACMRFLPRRPFR